MTLVFLVIPRSLRRIWLLVISYYFYMSWHPQYAILITTSKIITFTGGLLIERMKTRQAKWLIIVISLISNLLILAVFKYADFAIQTLSVITSRLGQGTIERRLDLLLPVGISFYTFQALSYTIDVYNEYIKAERNIISYALFVSSFPQLVAGPIERSGNLLSQVQKIKEIKLWNFERVRDGLLLIFWGLFQKLVIADRAAILVKQVYGNYSRYSFLELAIASVLFAFQIYCDFGGYTNIARGAHRLWAFP